MHPNMNSCAMSIRRSEPELEFSSSAEDELVADLLLGEMEWTMFSGRAY